jgi:fructose-1,6-bisphosphatase I
MSAKITLESFIGRQRQRQPGASRNYLQLILDMAAAGTRIAAQVNQAALAGTLGASGRINVHGESVQMLDEAANETLVGALERSGLIAAMASEEMEDIYPVPRQYRTGPYLLVFDPVDGSSNIDVNVSIGTIFSVYRRPETNGQVCQEEFLQRGWEQLCAGYITYGSSTMLVYTAGDGTHGFTLDTYSGDFVLTHENIRMPSQGKIYSANEANRERWSPQVRDYIDHLRSGGTGRRYSGRYIGSLVADFHRNLLKGGVFLYPADSQAPQGKLRLLYEAGPLAFIAEQAGGKASTGTERILDLKPTGLHQRVPLVIGSAEDVDLAEHFNAESKTQKVAQAASM